MNSANKRSRVLLVGMMATGKTTVARILASRRGWPVYDNDDMVHARTGRSAQRLLAEDGEQALRRAETDALQAAVDEPPPAVITVAAGVILVAENRRLIADAGFVVWLRARMDTIAARASSTAEGERPWLGGNALAALERLYVGRAPLYAATADLILDVDDASPADIADAILAALA